MLHRGSQVREVGASIPEFVMVTVILVPFVLGIFHLALVLHVRNTLTSSVSAGARAGSGLNAEPGRAVARTRELIATTLAEEFARDVTARNIIDAGVPVVEVRARAEVPALGLFGPATHLDVVGHAVRTIDPDGSATP
jgi:hypothetical protein